MICYRRTTCRGRPMRLRRSARSGSSLPSSDKLRLKRLKVASLSSHHCVLKKMKVTASLTHRKSRPAHSVSQCRRRFHKTGLGRSKKSWSRSSRLIWRLSQVIQSNLLANVKTKGYYRSPKHPRKLSPLQNQLSKLPPNPKRQRTPT